jgi:hypothetical protein
MLHAEQKAHELRREIAGTEAGLAEVQPLIGRPGMPAETLAVYNALCAERARLFGELASIEIELLRGPSLCRT